MCEHWTEYVSYKSKVLWLCSQMVPYNGSQKLARLVGMGAIRNMMHGNMRCTSLLGYGNQVNRAELQAVIDVVDGYKFRPISVAVATDFAYVHDGLQGKALQWNAAGWGTPQGPPVNVDPWSEVLDKLGLAVCTFELLKVPSLVDIAGNEQTNELVERGRKLAPLYVMVRQHVRMPFTPQVRVGTSSAPCINIEMTPLVP